MNRPTDRAAFPQMHLDPPETAFILRHSMVDRIEYANHRRGMRTSFREIESVLKAIRIVAEIDLDHRPLGVDIDRHLDGDPVRRRAREGIVPTRPSDAPSRDS